MAEKTRAMFLSDIVGRIVGTMLLSVGVLGMMRSVDQVTRNCREVAAFVKTPATVTDYVAPDRTAGGRERGGRLEFTYRVEGAEHLGRLDGTTRGLSRTVRTILAQRRTPGEAIEVYCSPADPRDCRVLTLVDPEPFAVLLVCAPLALVGLIGLIRTEVYFRRTPAGKPASPLRVLVVTYAVLSLVSAFGLMLLASRVDWRIASIVGAILVVVVAPGGAWLAARWSVKAISSR